LEVEFDTGSAVGLKDENDFTLILAQDSGHVSHCNLFFQAEEVETSYREMRARGVDFLYPPQVNDWGYGAGLNDPDGRLVGLWDQKSMRQHDGG
jgi:predicted enzyme related to lactoylglutathione lyase